MFVVSDSDLQIIYIYIYILPFGISCIFSLVVRHDVPGKGTVINMSLVMY